MASPPANGGRRWSASPWLTLSYAEIVHSPDTYGVVILGDKDRDPLLVAHGVIREQLWRVHGSPRSAAHGMELFRYIETVVDREAERLARIVLDELTKSTGHPIAWEDFPAPLSGASTSEPFAQPPDS